MTKRFSALKDPLVIFLLLGGLIFFLERILAGNIIEAPQNINISLEDQKWLAHTWELQWNRQPSSGELQGLIESEIRERIYYREALTLGLDKNDTIIRRRLMQKLEFITETLDQPQPTNDQLQVFLESNSDKYRAPVSYSFRHIYFNPDNHPDAVEAAKESLQLLRASEGKNINLSEMGDRLPLSLNTQLVSEQALTRNLGSQFSQILDGLQSGQWQGPVKSGLGVHLVFIESKIPAHVPVLTQLRSELVRDYVYEHKLRVSDEAYQAMKSRYQIAIEAPVVDSVVNNTRG